MRVLITGAAGFIGRHVSNALVDAGHAVHKLDIVFGDDITQPLPKIEGLDAVVHLAAIAAPRECDKDPARAFNVNVNGTYQVLKMALESGAKKVVFSSSAHVYNIPPLYLPTDEMAPLRLNNTYTTTKILGEQLCDLYWTNHGLSYITLRLFNAYGLGQQLGYFVPDMISKARAGHIGLTDGNTTKDWVYVTDVADAFIKALTSDYIGAINVGTGIETDLGTIAQIIAKEVGASWGITESTKATRMRAHIGRAKRVLGWEPKVTLEEGIDAVLGRVKA